MNTMNLILDLSKIGKEQLDALAQSTLADRDIDYDRTIGLGIQCEMRKGKNMYIISFQTPPNPFEFTPETYFLELDENGLFIDILTPRGRLSTIDNLYNRQLLFH